MAAYAVTVVLDTDKAIRLQHSRQGVLFGTCDLTNYNTTGAEITEITNLFKSNPRVMCAPVSDNFYLVRWDITDACFHAYYFTDAHDHDFAVQSSSAIGSNMEIGISADADSATLEGGTGVTAARTLSTNTPIQAATKAAGTEVASDVDVGLFEFLAIGLAR